MRPVSREAIFDALQHFMDQSLDGIVVLVPHSETLLALEELQAGVPVVAVGSIGDSAVNGAKVDQKRAQGTEDDAGVSTGRFPSAMEVGQLTPVALTSGRPGRILRRA